MPALASRPLLAVIYSPRSRPWSEIVDAAEGLCRLLWVADSSSPGMGVVAGALRKFGTVVDAAGCSAQSLVQRVHAERPDGITSYTDGDLHRHAWLAESLGLPGPSVRAAALLTDKLLQREVLQAAGVPEPRFAALGEPAGRSEVGRLCEELSFPMLLKPRDGAGCRGILPVADRSELARRLAGLESPGQMILEERMGDCPAGGAPYAGRVCLDSLVSEGVVSHVGVTGLFTMVPPFRSSGGFFPADLPPAAVAELFEMATACILALGGGSGCYRTEVKLTPEGYKVIEVNGRPTGLTPPAVKLASGLPLLQLCMRLALGEHVVVKGPVTCERVGYRYYREPPMSAEKVVAIEGLKELGERPGVVQVDAHKSPGDLVSWRNGSVDRVFQVTGAVAGYAELAEHYQACTHDVSVTYEHGAEDAN
ncbi:MAG: ATP-grasp domain-containing protein [Acidimicrobiales bacterium]